MSTETKDTRNIVERLIAAQRAMKPALKDATNTHFRNSYTTLGSAWDACKEALWNEGLTVVQVVELQDGVFGLGTWLYSTGPGEVINSFYPLRPARENDPQAFASCVTYARRYSLMAMVGLVPEDDDGNEASAPAPGAAPAPVQVAKSTGPTKTQLDALKALATKMGADWKVYLKRAANGKSSALELTEAEAALILGANK